jgi:hypothetical protein
LAFTLAKNATKSNPSKIIPLQPTRKEKNWETEETMERATVTLETERGKWPNPGCYDDDDNNDDDEIQNLTSVMLLTQICSYGMGANIY